MQGYVVVALVDVNTGAQPPEASPNQVILRADSEAAPQVPAGGVNVIIRPTSTRRFGLRFTQRGGTGNMTLVGAYSALTIVEI